MKTYHVDVIHDDGWYVGRVLERPGVTTQGRTMDELLFMVRDAIALMWNERDVQLELIVPPPVKVRPGTRPATPARGAR